MSTLRLARLLFLQVDVEDELAKLHVRFKESLSVYNMACQDAAAAEQKVINILKQHVNVTSQWALNTSV